MAPHSERQTTSDYASSGLATRGSAATSCSSARVEIKVVLNERLEVLGISNQATFDTLRAAGIDVVWAPTTFTLTHEKCIVVDAKTAWIMTMNGTKSALVRNREFLAIDTLPRDVEEAEAQFTADFAGLPFVPVGALLMSPTTSRPGSLGF